MSDEHLAIGTRKEPRIDGVLEWSRPEKGILVFQDGETIFKDWIIRNEEIDEAVLNSEKMYWKLTQSLAIRSGTDEYLFSLTEPLSSSHNFPFDVHTTSKASFAGKFVKFFLIFGGVYLAMYLLSFLSAILASSAP
jgi:hypothetical protein